MLFVGGPCTYGPGIVVSDSLKETLRSHTDIAKENAKYTKKSYKFYEELGVKAVGNGHTIDIFPQSSPPGRHDCLHLAGSSVQEEWARWIWTEIIAAD